MDFRHWKTKVSVLPLVPILRGITADRALSVAHILRQNGFYSLEIPMNSPDAVETISRCVRELGDEMVVGAGTVSRASEVKVLQEVGCHFIVSPHSDPAVITATKSAKMVSIPGVSTPTEAFAALQAGADALKVFPAELITPKVFKAWRAVLPRDVWLLPVGGITPSLLGAYWAVGANGFGLGSALYSEGFSTEEINNRSLTFAEQYQLDCK